MAFVQSCSPTRLTPRIEFSTIIVAELRPGAGVVVPALAGPLPVRRRALPAGRRRARRPPRAPHGALRHDERHVRAQGTFGQTEAESQFTLVEELGHFECRYRRRIFQVLR